MNGSLIKSIRSVYTTAVRFISVPRPVVARYDTEVVAKYPSLIDVINRKKSVDSLNAIEKAAYYVATFNQGGARDRKMRKREYHRTINSYVDKKLNTMIAEEKRKRVEINRVKEVIAAEQKIQRLSKLDKHSKLSTYKDTVNRPAKIMEFVVTKTEQ